MEQIAVGAVAYDHKGLWKLFADLDAPLFVLVDDLHGHTHIQQLRRQIVADFAGAHDGHRGRLAAEYPQLAEKLGDLTGR